MRIVSLNIWGAGQGQIFFDYISGLVPVTDIFCFQEVFAGGAGAPQIYDGAHMFCYQELCELLPDFNAYFAEKSSGYADARNVKVDWPVKHGIAIFARKNFVLIKYSCKTLGNSVPTGAPAIEGLVKSQVLSLQTPEGQALHVINMHGMSRPGDKLDTPERLSQSQELIKVIAALPKDYVILCGDFNLMPDTQSIRVIEKSGLANLIKSFKISNTRNEISWQQYPDKQNFADYIFVSPNVKVKSLQAPYNEVSDHLPLILDFTL